MKVKRLWILVAGSLLLAHLEGCRNQRDPVSDKAVNGDRTETGFSTITSNGSQLRPAGIEDLGELIAANKVGRLIYSFEDGVVVALHVTHGERVMAGDVLLELENLELDLMLMEVEREIDEAESELHAMRGVLTKGPPASDERDKLVYQISVSQKRLDYLNKKRQLLKARRERLAVRSPVDGIIHAPKAEVLLPGRPVSRGEILMAIRKLADAPRANS